MTPVKLEPLKVYKETINAIGFRWDRKRNVRKIMLAFWVKPSLVQHGTVGPANYDTDMRPATKSFLNDSPTALHMVTPQTVLLVDLAWGHQRARSGTYKKQIPVL